MKYSWILILSFLVVSFAGCDSSDDVSCVELDFAEPDWRQDIVYVASTNTPSTQIDRFVDANNLDTVQTSSGLVYTIFDQGGNERPDTSSNAVCWYKGYFTDGRIFDESNVCSRGPLNSALTRLIPAWQEGIPKIGKGGKMILFARPSIAYGSSTPSNGRLVLVFEIELLDFE